MSPDAERAREEIRRVVLEELRRAGAPLMAELRSFIFIDQLQPQTMCYLGTWIRGRLPRTDMAAQVIEIAPGLDIEPLTDVALKSTDVQAGILVVERQFGYLEIHSRSTAAVVSAGAAVLDALEAAPQDAVRPQILASELISRIDHQHAFLINRNKIGSMALPGESLFVLEMQPASYAILATNEAEKAARIKVVDYRMIGATGPGVPDRRRGRRPRRRGRGGGRAGEGRVSARDDDLLRSVTREVLAELLPDLLEGALTAPASNGNGIGSRARGRAPVPAPPIAKVHRPSGWRAPDPTATPAPETASEGVLRGAGRHRDRRRPRAFVAALARRLESPAERAAILSGKTRFRLAAEPAESAPAPGTIRVESGAVTERTVKEAAKAGARLVLSPRAVLTPLARDSARILGVEIEKEKRC